MLTIIDSCLSTNSEIDRDAPHGHAIMALTQTAGRGQRGNSWEAMPGQNITLSVMLRPQGLHAANQFAISEAVCLAVADLITEIGIGGVCVKWPNDVYVANGKIAGILIENVIGSGGYITRSIAGIGVNVNQETFVSDAPNPVSIWQLTARKHSIEALAERLLQLILLRLPLRNHNEYRRRLWRGSGIWPWVSAQGEVFEAEIVDVLPDGRLCLSGRPTPYAFKEVKPLGYKN